MRKASHFSFTLTITAIIALFLPLLLSCGALPCRSDQDCPASRCHITDAVCLPAGHICSFGQETPCYPHADSTPGTGTCKQGKRFCSKQGQWGTCLGAVVPTTEECGDALDNDCDGQIDEGCKAKAACQRAIDSQPITATATYLSTSPKRLKVTLALPADGRYLWHQPNAIKLAFRPETWKPTASQALPEHAPHTLHITLQSETWGEPLQIALEGTLLLSKEGGITCPITWSIRELFATCPTGTNECNKQCVDHTSDPKHCGRCNHACLIDETCKAGQCIPFECKEYEERCGLSCVNLKSDRRHCGWCNKPCKVGESCEGGICRPGNTTCEAGKTKCDGKCVDLQLAPKHCGRCNHPCNPYETCQKGLCVPDKQTCDNGKINCDNQCIDPLHHPQHCGACKASCKTGQRCENGKCKTPPTTCPMGETYCQTKCVALASDKQHCGSCHQACKTNEVCNNGTCQTCRKCPIWGHTGDMILHGVRADSQNNTYIIGNLFRQTTFAGTIIKPKGLGDLFVAKLSPSGTLLWHSLVPIASPGQIHPRSLTTTPNGETYVAGYWSNKVTFGSTTLTARGSQDAFVAKLDTTGKWKWAIGWGGPAKDSIETLVVGPNQTISMVLHTRGDISIAGTLHSHRGKSFSPLAYTLQIDHKGQHKWTRPVLCNSVALLSQIDTDTQGNLYIGIDCFGSLAFAKQTLASPQTASVALLKYTHTGTEQWARMLTPTTRTAPRSLHVAGNGDILLAGSFSGTLTQHNKTYQAIGGNDLFVSRWTNNGTLLWLNTAGGPSNIQPTQITTTPKGDIFLATTFLQSITTNHVQLTGQGTWRKGAILQLTSGGKWKGALPLISPGDTVPSAITTTSQGQLVFVGFFNAPTIAIQDRIYTQQTSGTHGFIAKLPSPSILCPTNHSICNNTCTSLTTNPLHCGSCNQQCPSGQTCQNGACK